MKKQEIHQRIHNLEEELAELKHLLDQPEGRWRAEIGGYYCYMAGSGAILNDNDNRLSTDERRYKTGNYFQTEEQAKASNIYKILNDPYEYFIAGVSDNWDDVPKDGSAEWYHTGFGWVSTDDCYHEHTFNYRWKRI